MKKYIIGAIAGIIIIGLIVVIGGYFYISGGYYNISATVPHTEMTLEMLEKTMDSSVKRHAAETAMKEITISDSLRGFNHYNAMCVDCHGAPGTGRSEFGRGLYPKGPTLIGIENDWNDRELFWIIKNGIKMSGMPSFGKTHSDEQIWEIVAFTKNLSALSPRDYEHLVDSLGNEGMEMEEEHEHDDTNGQ